MQEFSSATATKRAGNDECARVYIRMQIWMYVCLPFHLCHSALRTRSVRSFSLYIWMFSFVQDADLCVIHVPVCHTSHAAVRLLLICVYLVCMFKHKHETSTRMWCYDAVHVPACRTSHAYGELAACPGSSQPWSFLWSKDFCRQNRKLARFSPPWWRETDRARWPDPVCMHEFWLYQRTHMDVQEEVLEGE